MKKALLSAFALMLLATPALAQQGNQLPQPKILILNRGAILQASKVGQDIARQVQALANQAKADMTGQQKALQTEGQALQQQIAILAPDAKQKKIDAFQAKEQGLQAAAQRKEESIQYTLQKAQDAVAEALKPILTGLMQQRGANIILDSNAVMLVNTGGFDVTQQAIDQLNQKMPTYKVTLQTPPAGK